LVLDDDAFAKGVHWRYRHLSVDEFQDINPDQYRFIDALMGDRRDLFVVGDPNQSIYGWRGADPGLIDRLALLVPDMEVVRLDRNHRCTPEIVAAAAAASADARRTLELAARVDGHAENAAASVLGGLVVAGESALHGVVARSLTLDDAWQFVLVVPDLELATADARRVLPSQVSLHDAVRNLNSLGLLIAGLADYRDFVQSSMDDLLHQPYRMELLEFARPLLAILRESGAAGSCWSGAGSTMLGLAVRESSDAVADAARAFLRERSISGEVFVLSADRTGLVTR
jgi:hypothetical protein